MGCAGSTEVKENSSSSSKKGKSQSPSQQPSGRTPRPEPTPEELEKKRLESEEVKRWEEEARRVGPSAPPKPILPPSPNEQQYKQYMMERYEYEAWENKIILLGRKLRKEHKEQHQKL
jgi:hypothetical protein